MIATTQQDDHTDQDQHHEDHEHEHEEQHEEQHEEEQPEFTEEQQKQSTEMLQSAIEHFERAYKIRKVELGEHHAHTVSTRSQLGGTIAAQIIQTSIHARVLNHTTTTTSNEPPTPPPQFDLIADRARWDIAEDHLRAALRTAVDNPRGERVQP